MSSGQWGVFPGLAQGFLHKHNVRQAPGKGQRIVEVLGAGRAADGKKHGSHNHQVVWAFATHADVCVGRGKYVFLPAKSEIQGSFVRAAGITYPNLSRK